MYDSFDNMYQATIGIDFLSKASQRRFPQQVLGHRLLTQCHDRRCILKTGQCGYNSGIQPDRNDSGA